MSVNQTRYVLLTYADISPKELALKASRLAGRVYGGCVHLGIFKVNDYLGGINDQTSFRIYRVHQFQYVPTSEEKGTAFVLIEGEIVEDF